MHFVTFILFIIPIMALIDGELKAGGIGILSLFLAWMTGISFAGLRFVERPLITVVVQGGLLAFAVWLSTQTDWVFLVIKGTPIVLLYVTLFTFAITYILTPRSALAQEVADRTNGSNAD